MSHNLNTSPSLLESVKSKKASRPKRQRVNWHEAVSCAVQIELQDYTGYAGLLINQTDKKDRYSSLDVSRPLLSLHYPRS